MEATASKLPYQGPQTKTGRSVNWALITRVGLVVGLVAFFVGFALYETFNLVWRGGVVDKGNYFEVDLKSMSNFEMDQRVGTLADVPERFRNLDGKKVLLQGEVAPADFALGRGSDFLLCYSVAKCCFGGPPKVQHFVSCRISKDLQGKRLPDWMWSGQIKVFGTMHVKMQKEGELTTSIYQLDVEKIERVS
jgi:hypothetical protein